MIDLKALQHELHHARQARIEAQTAVAALEDLILEMQQRPIGPAISLVSDPELAWVTLDAPARQAPVLDMAA